MPNEYAGQLMIDTTPLNWSIWVGVNIIELAKGWMHDFFGILTFC